MLISFVRTIILYILVVAALRVMGKRQIGQLQPSELVVAMMISELASIPMENVGTPLVNGIIPILTLIIAEATFSFLTLKSKKVRKMISGTPTILIEKGRVLEKEMERLRFNIDDLMEELRTNGYANIMDIEYAIIETNGLLSVIPKSNKRPVTPSDLDMNIKYEGMPFLTGVRRRCQRKGLAGGEHFNGMAARKTAKFWCDGYQRCIYRQSGYLRKLICTDQNQEKE